MPDQTEPADAGNDHGVPADLLELHQVLEYAEAVRVGEQDPTA